MELNKNAKKIGFLGIGQAGGNVCEVAEFHGYTTLALNTSPEDLDSMTIVKNKKKIGSSGGCGKDRDQAKTEVKSLYKDIIPEVKEVFKNDIELVYIVFSTGGGTGSGMAPIITDILNKSIPNINFSIMGIIPSLDESIISQINTLECLKEIYNLNLPTMIIDNNKYKEGSKFTRKKLFDIVNNKIIHTINILFDDERRPSKYGNIDQKDLFKLLSTPGINVITESNFDSVAFNTKGLTRIIMDNIKDGIFVDIDYDKVVKRTGYLFHIDESLTKDIDLVEIDETIGKPLEVFEGYYENNDTSNNNVISILSGLTFPTLRLLEIEELINKQKDNVLKSNNSTVNLFDSSSNTIGWMDDFRDSSLVNKDKSIDESDDVTFDIDDILSKY